MGYVACDWCSWLKPCSKSIVIHTALRYVLQIIILLRLDCSACSACQSLQHNTGEYQILTGMWWSKVYTWCVVKSVQKFKVKLRHHCALSQDWAKQVWSLASLHFPVCMLPNNKKKNNTPKYRFRIDKPSVKCLNQSCWATWNPYPAWCVCVWEDIWWKNDKHHLFQYIWGGFWATLHH